MPPAVQERRFDTAQLGQITRTCKRWMAVESLPEPIRCRLAELDSLSQRLRIPSSLQENESTLLALVKRSCQSLRHEFAKIQVTFDCPSCPLRAD